MSGNSFQRFDVVPSAVLFDGVVPLPIYAVTQLSLTETYHLPPLGSRGAQAIVSTHDDTVSLAGVLAGPTRYAQKALLETLAETSKRGTKLFVAGPKMSGLVLLTAMTIRTDMQITKLTFGATSAKRQTLDVGIELTYIPPASALAAKLGDLLGSVAVGALTDAGGN